MFGWWFGLQRTRKICCLMFVGMNLSRAAWIWHWGLLALTLDSIWMQTTAIKKAHICVFPRGVVHFYGLGMSDWSQSSWTGGWTRMAKALLLGFDRQSFCLNAEPKFPWMIRCFQAKTEGYWNNMEQLFCMLVPVSGNPEAEGNGRFHQRPQYDRDRFFRRQQTLCTLHSKV